MRVLITGGAGFIGSHIADAYVAAGHDVLVVDDLSSGHAENVPAAARLEEIDIREPAVASVVQRFRPDVINHHAAQMNVRVSVDDPCLDAEINVLAMVRILQAGKDCGVSKFIFASSGGTVYGDPDRIPTDESQATHPICPYGVSKLAGEHYLHYFRATFGIPYVAFRYANIFGPRQDPHGEAGVIAIFCKRLLRGEDVTIFGDGLQTRDYVFVGDVVRANVRGLETDYVGAVNIGTGVETDVVTLYERVAAQVERPGKAVHADAKEGEVRRSCLDASRAREVLGWRPESDLDAGLAATVDFFRSRS
jgi:UDP-glucose 4-epimerase